MALWKVTAKGVQPVIQTAFKQESLLEENLEEWIASNPSILGEPLLVIGRQVRIQDVKDRLDLLAVDPEGNIVVIELKRAELRDPVDFQALRYASYISKWRFEDFENSARNYLKKADDMDFNFNELFESFCDENGTEDVPDLNEDQRIIVVGAAVKDKLGSVALWLRERNVDVKLIEVQAYKDGDSVLIEPTIIVPTQVNRFNDVGRARNDGAPWIIDGKSWHLDKRCGLQTREMLLAIDKMVRENADVDGPRWNQKGYVAYRVNGYNWLAIHTRPNLLILDFYVKAKSFGIETLTKELGLAKFEKEESLAEKLGLPSSASVKSKSGMVDRIRIRVKDDFKIDSKAFSDFIARAYKAQPKS